MNDQFSEIKSDIYSNSSLLPIIDNNYAEAIQTEPTRAKANPIRRNINSPKTPLNEIELPQNAEWTEINNKKCIIYTPNGTSAYLNFGVIWTAATLFITVLAMIFTSTLSAIMFLSLFSLIIGSILIYQGHQAKYAKTVISFQDAQTICVERAIKPRGNYKSFPLNPNETNVEIYNWYTNKRISLCAVALVKKANQQQYWIASVITESEAKKLHNLMSSLLNAEV